MVEIITCNRKIPTYEEIQYKADYQQIDLQNVGW